MGGGLLLQLWYGGNGSLCCSSRLRRQTTFHRESFCTSTDAIWFSCHHRKSGHQIRALQKDGERRRLRPGPLPDYPPPGPLGPSNSDVEDELELSLLRNPRRRSTGLRRTAGADEEKEDKRLPPVLRGTSKYILAGVFVFGMAAGIAADTVINIEPNNVASREVIDRQTPNPDVCIANGFSAMVLDQRLFISFNPFNVYVSQTEVKPGCVLRQSNWQVLESRGLVNSAEVQACKRNMNTFGFVGDLRQAPEISCVYHSETAENQFLKDPSKATLGDGFQPKTFEE
ncbi:hypothetical protein CY35_01G040600 [Sphagnum magellanicum]|jgi:hypothetical protein|nr:hypothetical protein CY35_01G040600 [Sphagnum magellanicum]